jgi:hypothetical protein
MDGMLVGSGLSTEHYDALLIGWSQQDVQRGVTLGADGLTHSPGEAADARQGLIDEHSWTINDSGLAP